MRINPTIVAFGLGFAGAGACQFERATDHCANFDGDAYCARLHPDGDLPFCVRGSCETENLDGCWGERPQDDACYSPCGGGLSLPDDPDCEGVADGSSSSGSGGPTSISVTEPTSATEPTSEPTVSTTMTATEASSSGPSGCVDSSECTDASSPICADSVCVPCTDGGVDDGDAACSAKDSGAPACRDDGQCVQCTSVNDGACGDTTPVCDEPSSACVGCAFHEQCDAGACEIATGACFDGVCVVEVDGDGGADEDNVSAAIGDGCIVIVHAAAGGYSESVVIDGGITVAVIAAEGEEALLLGEGGNGDPSFAVSGGAQAYFHGLLINGNDAGGLGITVDGASMWLDRASVGGNTGGGIALTNDAYVQLRNSFVGGDVNDIAAVDVAGGTLDALYSTLGAGFGNAAALRCDAAATVRVRNSLLVARTDDPELDCAADSLLTSATEAELGDMETDWFGGFAAGNFHLTRNIPDDVLTTARWMTGDPTVDIDGDDPRPSENDAPDVAGADVP